MRYVSDIKYGWASKRKCAVISPFESTGGKLKVRDTCQKSVETVDIRDNDGDFYGLGVDSEDGTSFAVKHTAKTASLYKYVISASTRICDPHYSASGESVAVLSGGHLLSFRIGSDSNLDVCMTNELVKCLGPSGSVIVRQAAPFDIPNVFTMYEFLGSLCHECGRNLLIYDTLRLYSPDRRFETIIRLSQTAKAKRFFTKMYFDVTGDSHEVCRIH